MNNKVNEIPSFDSFFESLLRTQLITTSDINQDPVTYKKTGNDVNPNEDIKND